MMGKINVGVLKDFQDGTYVHDVDFDQTFEIIRTAINDNYDKIVNRYTKAEVDGLLYNSGLGVATSIAVSDVLPTPTIQGKFLLKSPENIAYYCTGAAWIQITTAGDLSSVQTTLNNAITAHTGNTSNPHAVTTAQIGAVPLSQKAAANGIASLDSGTKIPIAQIPTSSMVASARTVALSLPAISRTTAENNASTSGAGNWFTMMNKSMTKTKGMRSIRIITNQPTFNTQLSPGGGGGAGSATNAGTRVYVNGVLKVDTVSVSTDTTIDITDITDNTTLTLKVDHRQPTDLGANTYAYQTITTTTNEIYDVI